MELPSLTRMPETAENTKSSLVPQRKLFAKQIIAASVFLLLSIWIIAAWLFGSLFQFDTRAKHLKILLIEFDGSDIGNVIQEGARATSGSVGLATFVAPYNTSTYSVESVYKDVFNGHYWGALVVMPNATHNLNEAIATGDTTYDPSLALLSIWNEAHWALVGESIIIPSIHSAVSKARSLYLTNYAAPQVASSQLTTAQSNILLHPFSLKTKNISSFPIGIKPFINTVGFVFPSLIQFFFSMALAKISAQAHLYSTLSTSRNYLIRFISSRIWTFIIALSSAAWFFAFSESRTGAKPYTFILITLNMWMYTLISFEYHDLCGAFIPMQFLPVSVIAWIIWNVTAAAFPCVLKPAIYRLEYAVPSVNVFEIFGTILSGGAGNTLGRNLGVLLAWLVVTMFGGWVANKRRCSVAMEWERRGIEVGLV